AAVSILFLGLAYAMILYIISVGLSVTMGLMGFVNLAHGAFAMAGGYITVTLMNRYGVPFGAALLLAFIVVALLSVVLERTLYARLYGAGELEQVLFTIGLVFMAVAVVRKIWGSLPQPITLPAALSGQIDLGFRSFPTYRSFLIAFSLTLILLLWLGIERTNFGARLRAAVDNRRMAESLGINTSRLFTLSFALGSGLAALGGGLGADILAIYPGYAMEYLVYFLMVVAVGGLGSIRGPFVAALLLGIGDTACKYLVPELGAFFIYLAMIGLLLWRPAGLFGRA
ncbi:MAG TPA: branched-chain amino acid ABC transporter permease, partial [Acetobacteraceae bacterium]|nr:branched-chain amino acid ABC transporter permease [Acetobacteraceae bacterium]